MEEEQYKHYANKYIQIWFFLILVFTCLFILIFIGIYSINLTDNYLTRDKLLDYRIISSLNPKYPPPLFNFMN